MSNLSNYLVEQILLDEDTNSIKKTVVVYSGRFQPFHSGHYKTYQLLVKKFGKDNVYIGTTNVVEKPKSPFNFKEKVEIMTTMFGIPKSHIVQLKQPYKPVEILSKFDENTTAFITVVGEKDEDRLGGKYFRKYTGTPTEPYKDAGYVFISPSQSNPISGTAVRNGLGNGTTKEKHDFFKNTAYPKFNPKIYDLITSKLHETFEIQKETIEEWLLSESTINGVGQADDGPAGFFPNLDVFTKISHKRAKQIGYDVLDMIMTKEVEDYYEHPDYPNGPVKAVSFYPAGVIGKMTPNNQIDIYAAGAYTDWYKHVTRQASLVGYQVVTTQLQRDVDKLDRELSVMMAKADKEIEKEFELNLNESITLPVEVGDTLLMGKWKNKPVIVKTIGKDEHGMPTINGKKVVTFRFGKKGPNIFDNYVEVEDTDMVKEDLTTGFKNLGISRKMMPQINSEDVKKYLDYIKGQGYSYKIKAMPISKLNLTQGEINKDKVEQLMSTSKSHLAKPVIVSSGGYILDGHHRVLALYALDNNAKIPVIQINLEIGKLLKLSRDWNDVSFKHIHESKIITEAANKLKIAIPPSVQKINKAFKKHGKKLYIVGGAVRDAILGKTPHDFDLTTDAKPHEIVDICEKEGLKHVDTDIIYGMVVVNGDEVVTFRKDIGGNRKLDGIDYTDIAGDVRRRDLTINALFYDIERKEIVDLVGGIKDLQDKRIRTVGNAADRFEEDHLRKLRAVRFTVKLGGTMDPDTLLAIKKDPTLKDVSDNRIRMEFMKSVESAKSTKIYLDLMEKLKFLPLTFPGLKITKPYIDESDYIVLMAYLLNKNSKSTLETKLNSLKYENPEIIDITFLQSLDKFKPEEIVEYKKQQKRTHLTDKQILDYGKHTNKDYSKFVKFNTSVKGGDAPKGVTGKEVGNWIASEEKRKFLNEVWRPREYTSFIVNGDLPISEPIMKKIIGDKIVTTIHVTDLKGYIQLKKMEGKSKSLATFSTAYENSQILRGGLLTAGGIYTVLQGHLLLNSYTDIHSDNDKNGRRWIEFNKIFDRTTSSITKQYYTTFLHKDKEYIDAYTEYMDKDRVDATGKKRERLIKRYIELAYEFMLKHKDQINDSFGNNLKSPPNSRWDELIINKIKIVDVIALTQYGEENISQDVRDYFGKNLKIAKTKADLIKFIKKSGGIILTEMARPELKSVESYADRVMNPVDIEFTNHFFDRLNDPRNQREISPIELEGFFNRLSKQKTQFVEFLKQYKEVMVKDSKTNLNIPFVKSANKLIAKTILRTRNWTQHKTPEFKFEGTEQINELAWESKTIDMCIAEQIPITSKLMNQIFGKVQINTLHITNPEGLDKLAKLQGTKKSISTFTAASTQSNIAVGMGIRTAGGIIVAMKGDLLVASADDIMSRPDNQGRRWVSPYFLWGKWGNAGIIAGNKKLSDFAEKYGEIERHMGDFHRISISKLSVTNAEINDFIRLYIKEAEKYALKHKDEIIKHNLGLDNTARGGWNEVLVNNIKIEEILLMSWKLDSNSVADIEKKYKNVTFADTVKDIPPFVNKYGKFVTESVIVDKQSLMELDFNPDLAKKTKVWYNFHPQEIVKVSDNIIDLVKTAYSKTSDGGFVNSKADINRSDYWSAITLDNEPDADAVIFGRNTKQGIKLQGIGHDGKELSKTEVVKHLGRQLKKQGFWVEASDSLEHVLYKVGIPYVSSEKVAQSIFPNSDLKMTGNKGQYTRKLENGKVITETIFGKPKVSVREDIDTTLNEAPAGSGTDLVYLMRHDYFPIFPSIMEKIIGKTTVLGIHSTDVWNYQNVEKLEGTKKTISTFTNLTSDSPMMQLQGLRTQGGVFVAIKGTLLLRSIRDLWSNIDVQGRKWVPFDEFFPKGSSYATELGKLQMMNPIYKKYHRKLQDESTFSNAELGELTKAYIDIMYKFMLKYKNEIHDKFTGKLNDLEGKWNELLIGDIRIVDVLVVLKPGVTDTDVFKRKIGNDVKITYDVNDLKKFINKYGGLITEGNHTPNTLNEITLLDVASKHNMDVDDLSSELKKGFKVERNSGKTTYAAEETTLENLLQNPNYYKENINEEVKQQPTITFLIGPPASGKSTWVAKHGSGKIIVSRDDIAEKVAKVNKITYNDLFDGTHDDLQNKISADLQNHINASLKSGKDMIVDMTNVSKKSRNGILARVPKTYIKNAVVFNVSRGELLKRLKQREKETGKRIPPEVLDDMMSRFEKPTKDEFDNITNEGFVLQDLEKKYDIELELWDTGKILQLDKIIVPKTDRVSGKGTKVMNTIVNFADKQKKPIYLTPSTSYGATSVSRLTQFYKQFGFVPNKDTSISKATMVRYPSTNENINELNDHPVNNQIKNFKDLFSKLPSELQKRIYSLKDIPQSPKWHPEGNVLKHTIVVVNRALKTAPGDIDLALAAMFHDIGKDATGGINPKTGAITHYGHEFTSAQLVKKYDSVIKSLGGDTDDVFYIVNNHMRMKNFDVMRIAKQREIDSHKAFGKLKHFTDKMDKGGLKDSIEELLSDVDAQLESFVFQDKNKIVLKEGGAYGHMNHPFDTEINLTFGQLKDIVIKALDGNLEVTKEKTDGQALAISWKNGKLIAARNKGHLKNQGENALDIKGISDKFQNRGGLTDAYNFAMQDLSKAIGSLSQKQRDKIFQNGSSFMNLEVIWPESVNVIPYGQPLLVFHSTMQYNLDGVAIGQDVGAAKTLAGMIKQVNQDTQSKYTIQGPPMIELPKNQNLSSKKSGYLAKISKLQKEFGLKDSDGVAAYHQAWWDDYITKNSPTKLDKTTQTALVKRWAFYDKGFKLNGSTIKDEKTLAWAQKLDSEDQKKISKDNLMKFEDIFLGVGADVLEFTKSVLTVNPDDAIRKMKDRISQTIKDVQKSNDPKKIDKLKLELKRLNAIGGFDKIVPSEGIVFTYNGHVMKLTGSFASVNQLLGIFFE